MLCSLTAEADISRTLGAAVGAGVGLTVGAAVGSAVGGSVCTAASSTTACREVGQLVERYDDMAHSPSLWSRPDMELADMRSLRIHDGFRLQVSCKHISLARRLHSMGSKEACFVNCGRVRCCGHARITRAAVCGSIPRIALRKRL